MEKIKMNYNKILHVQIVLVLIVKILLMRMHILLSIVMKKKREKNLIIRENIENLKKRKENYKKNCKIILKFNNKMQNLYKIHQ